MVVKNFPRDGSGILAVYKQFGQFSALQVNIPKTVVVPLWASSLTSISKCLIADMMPEWSSVSVAYAATYLGFAVGPMRNDSLWTKAIAKYQDRVDLWSSAQIGLLYSINTYNTFSIPVLNYLGQLAALPDYALDIESRALRKLTPGPGVWCVNNDLWYLDQAFSFPTAFKCLKIVTWASQLRTAYFESVSERGSWDVRVKASKLWESLLDSDRYRERKEWNSWYMSSFVLQLDKAMKAAEAISINPSQVYRTLFKKHLQSGCDRAAASIGVRQELQKTLYQALLKHPSNMPNHDMRIRHKMEIWNSQIPEGILSRRFAQNYVRLAALVQPRVHAACWRAAWNGWCVDYRFRNISGRWWTKPCIFNCSPTAEDRIEHYCRCPHVTGFAYRYLGIQPSACHLGNFLLIESDMSDDALTLFAVLVYAVYRTFNQARHTDYVLSKQQLYDMLEENAKTGVRHHGKSTAVLFDRAHLRHIAHE